jgi:hypothetical protein
VGLRRTQYSASQCEGGIPESTTLQHGVLTAGSRFPLGVRPSCSVLKGDCNYKLELQTISNRQEEREGEGAGWLPELNSAQLEQGCLPSHLIFLRRQSSQAREILRRL